MPFLLYEILNIAIQAALELCFFSFFSAPEHAVWELAVVNLTEIPVFYFFYRRSCIREQMETGEGAAIWKNQEAGAGWSLFLTVLGGLFLSRGFNLLIGLTPLPTLFPGYKTATDSMYTGSLPALLAASVVTAPVLEELLVRGILYGRLKKALQNRYAAMVCASLLFGILHGNLVQGLFAFLTGLYLNWIYESEGSLIPAILAHGAINALTIFLTREEPAWLRAWMEQPPFYLTVTALCLLTGFWIWRKLPLKNQKAD